MKKINVLVSSPSRMIKLGNIIGLLSKPNMVIAMNGDLGAGKTTFTKGIGEALGIKRVINSPTFTIMKIYDVTNESLKISRLYHLDVYRITNASDDFELSEVFELGGLCVIEWADIIDELLPDDLMKIFIKDLGDDKRMVTLEYLDEYIDNLQVKLEEEKYEIIY